MTGSTGADGGAGTGTEGRGGGANSEWYCKRLISIGDDQGMFDGKKSDGCHARLTGRFDGVIDGCSVRRTFSFECGEEDDR